MSTQAVNRLPSSATRPRHPTAPRWVRIAKMICLIVAAFGFLFPFYYMIVASFQTTRDTSLAGVLPDPSNMTVNNYRGVNAAIDVWRSLLNSAIFTVGVLVGTLVFGVLVGYALAIMRFRGRHALFSAAILVQAVPFQLLMVPLYVMVVRTFHLDDTYMGMIFPFAINTAAVVIFRGYFMQLPRELFDAARIDGAGEFRVLWSVALPLVRPALLTATLLTFIGPWNEFLWPFLITKNESMQPLAVALANYMDKIKGAENPFGIILAGSVILAVPAVILYVIFQRYFTATSISSGVKG